METPWKFEIEVKEKTLIFNFPQLRKNQPPIFVTNVEKRGNLKHESSKKHANFPLFRKKTAAFGNHLLKGSATLQTSAVYHFFSDWLRSSHMVLGGCRVYNVDRS